MDSFPDFDIDTGGLAFMLQQERYDASSFSEDSAGNLVYRMTARNFNPMMATAGRCTIAEVEQLVAAGAIEPDVVVTPGIFVDFIFQGTNYEKRIEQRTNRPKGS